MVVDVDIIIIVVLSRSGGDEGPKVEVASYTVRGASSGGGARCCCTARDIVVKENVGARTKKWLVVCKEYGTVANEK